MAWVETDSLSFVARHESADSGYAQALLDRLEDLRMRLEEHFDEVPGDITVVVHDNPAWLAAAHPLLAAVRLTAAPAERRYLAGWATEGEVHVLNDEWAERRAAGEDSLRALHGTAERLYAQIVIAANNDELPPRWTPRRVARYLRWAWLLEGASQYFAGQVPLFRSAVRLRLREGERPSFPPSLRDAVVLGGTVFELLERAVGPAACAIAASRLRRDGPEANLELAFDAPIRDVERAWRSHLDEVTGSGASSTPFGVEPPPDLGSEVPPDLGSGAGLVEEPDEARGEDDRGEHPRQQPRR